jgi:hypothetical protein
MIDTTSDIDYGTPAILPEGDEALERVAWHARMARQAKAELDELEDIYDAELARMIERRENRARIITERLNWHTAPIESYHRMRLEADGKRTIELPHGTSKMTVPKQPKVWFADDKRAADWARRSHPELMRPPLISDVREVITVTDDLKVIDKTTGEVVDALVAQIPEPRWSFDPEPGSPW